LASACIGAHRRRVAMEGAASSSVEDRINLHQLMELKAAFEKADTDHGGSLDMEEFLEAFGGVLGKNLTHEQLTHLFMKIDANSDGSVDWDEFTNFMLLENQAAADMSDRTYQVRYAEQEAPAVDPNPKAAYHRDMVEGILILPKQEKVISSSRDGTIRAWNASNLQHLRTVKVSDSWVTDCTHFELSHRIGVTCIDRSISFFDVNSYELTGQLTGLDTSPLCLGYWADQEGEKMIVGDDLGNITLSKIPPPPGTSDDTSSSATSYRISRDKRHSDWVTKVCFYPDLNFMVSSSLDGALKIGDLERRPRATRVLGEEKLGSKKGIYCFDWSTNSKVLASCGLERTVSLWNPYTRSGKPQAVLQGHQASVHRVTINDDHYQIISCSADKYIKVWDLRNYKCLQTLQDKTHYRPEDRIAACTYDPLRQQLLTGTTQLKAWPMVKTAKRTVEAGHEHPLCAALYNHNFHQVVSGDESAQVCVWDVETGDMVFHFAELHPGSKMTAMAFDEAGRRLITGGNDGTVRVWNFSNGQCLKELKTESDVEVSSIMFMSEGQNKLIVAGGWNRKVLVWRDDTTSSAAEIEPDRRMAGHNEDIVSIAFSSPNLLATSGYDGTVLIWNMDSCVIKFSLSIPNLHLLEVDQRAIWKLIFLDNRAQALVGTGADGYIRFWNVKEGTLLLEHHAGHRHGESIVSMATNPENSFLFTGDTAGYMKVWDVHKFENKIGEDQRQNIIELFHWRAHDGCVASLDYIQSPKHELVLSASADARCKLWAVTADGIVLAGVLGESSGPEWSLGDLSNARPVEHEPRPGAGVLGSAAQPPASSLAAHAPAFGDADGDDESDDESGEEDEQYEEDGGSGGGGSFRGGRRKSNAPKKAGGGGGAGADGPADGAAAWRDPASRVSSSYVEESFRSNQIVTLPGGGTAVQQSTKDLISQILNRNSGKDPNLRRPAPVPTMHRLRIHSLADVSGASSRSTGTTPR